MKQRRSNVGAGLPAMAASQSTSLLNVTSSSRASPLPQGFAVCSRPVTGRHSPGSATHAHHRTSHP
ncbi:hypothetical protein CDH05_16955 [Pseudomonas lactis]|nr:hypothetical protein CDH05_16955 [Pseudomonas lactis]